MTKNNVKSIENVAEYKKAYLTRFNGEFIEIGFYDGTICSVYENYPGMGGHEIHGYNGYEINAVINQLLDCDWRLVSIESV